MDWDDDGDEWVGSSAQEWNTWESFDLPSESAFEFMADWLYGPSELGYHIEAEHLKRAFLAWRQLGQPKS